MVHLAPEELISMSWFLLLFCFYWRVKRWTMRNSETGCCITKRPSRFLGGCCPVECMLPSRMTVTPPPSIKLLPASRTVSNCSLIQSHCVSYISCLNAVLIVWHCLCAILLCCGIAQEIHSHPFRLSASLQCCTLFKQPKWSILVILKLWF